MIWNPGIHHCFHKSHYLTVAYLRHPNLHIYNNLSKTEVNFVVPSKPRSPACNLPPASTLIPSSTYT
jgi:hypothetical protein